MKHTLVPHGPEFYKHATVTGPSRGLLNYDSIDDDETVDHPLSSSSIIDVAHLREMLLPAPRTV